MTITFITAETGLFWRLMPSRSLALQGDKCFAGEKSKERITILFCTNLSGWTVKSGTVGHLSLANRLNPDVLKILIFQIVE